jgi:hypothetical protein
MSKAAAAPEAPEHQESNSEESSDEHEVLADPQRLDAFCNSHEEIIKKIAADAKLLGIGSPESSEEAQERMRRLRERFKNATDDFKTAHFSRSLQRGVADQSETSACNCLQKKREETKRTECREREETKRTECREREETRRTKRLVKRVMVARTTEYYTDAFSDSDKE